MQKIGVIGAGVMGSSIALVLAINNYEVILKDVEDDAIKNSKQKVEQEFKMLTLMKKINNITIEYVFDRIEYSTNFNNFKDLTIIIENATEDWEIKKNIYSELSKICDENTIIAVNTSCISITKIASLITNPKRVIGVHFMNPVILKDMVETIKGFYTDEETVNAIKEFLKAIGKTAIIVNDLPGFVANRLSHLFMNEAAFLVQDGVATPKDIDTIIKQGYGHKMGPLETADLIGLDTVVNSLKVLYESYQDPKFKCCPLLQKMVDANLLGRKTGQGFYKYN